MSGLLYERSIKASQLRDWPVNCSLRLGHSLEILFPFTIFRENAMVHHENAKDIELRILWSLVIKQIIIFLEQFAQFGIIIALGSSKNQIGRYSKE